jgi:hypothetical protein
MALKIAQEIAHGEKLPRGYGIAWQVFEPHRMLPRQVCMPVPLNVLARVLRDAWCYAATVSREVPANPRAAYREGYAAGRTAMFDQMASLGVELGRRGGMQ